MLYALKKSIPLSWVQVYHWCLSWCAAFIYGNPSEKMIVIGVTGTNGKTTTSYITAMALEASGFATGCSTTALFKIGDRMWINESKMTMRGRFAMQKLLRDMVVAGIKYAVVESSSQGIEQFRHAHIHFDICVLTNLTPEHIEAHGGFENYKKAKIKLFSHMARSKRKILDGKKIEKVAVLNSECVDAKDFSMPEIEKVLWYDARDSQRQDTEWGSEFMFKHISCRIQLPGKVNVENAYAALTVCDSLGISLEKAIAKLSHIRGVPGRFERIEESQPFSVIVDYAPEPASLSAVYEVVKKMPHKKIIHVLGSCGGGRDVARRSIMGSMASENADIVIITNEDPYDDDPVIIMEDVARGARQARGSSENIFIFPERRDAIFEAVKCAQVGDIVLLTGKGSETVIMGPNGSRIPWNEAKIAREAIRAKMMYT